MDTSICDQHRAAAAQRERNADDVPARLLVHHPVHVAVNARPVAGDARHHRVGVSMRDHQRCENVALVGDEALAVAFQIAAPLQPRIEQLGELLYERRRARIDQLEVLAQRNAEFAEALGDDLLAADQDRLAEALLQERVGGTDDARVLAFGEDDAFWIVANRVERRLQPARDRI